MTSRAAAASSRDAPSSTVSKSSKTANTTWTLDEHVAHLRSILSAAPAAEELQTTWDGFATGDEIPGITLGLRHYRHALDSGRRISSSQTRQSNDDGRSNPSSSSSLQHQGIPLSLVVRILKASWIADGTWPVVGCDATDEQTTVALPGTQPNNGTARIPRSVHPSATLLKGKPLAFLSAVPEPGPMARPDPTPSQVAQAYRNRGIDVAEPDPCCNSDEEVSAADAPDQAHDSAEG